MARTLLLLLLSMFIGVPGAAAEDRRIVIREPMAGSTVNAVSVPVELAVEGMDLGTQARWPGPGQFHVALDGVDVLQTTELRFALMGVAPGPHRLGVQLDGASATAVAPAEVGFTAQVVAPPAGASWLLSGLVATTGAGILGLLAVLWIVWVRPNQAEPIYDSPAPDAPEATELEAGESR
ncbi:MAG TPA: hypothetical protein VM536_21985 [Chloroflexia bacterium]|nr:hypothetical protein [Chloroflexia bacterium]